jgi:replicative DNA helicase
MTEYENGDPSDNSAELIIAKHRNGSLEDIRLRFEASLARFSDITDLDNLATFESKMNYGSDDENGGYDFPENRNDAPF